MGSVFGLTTIGTINVHNTNITEPIHFSYIPQYRKALKENVDTEAPEWLEKKQKMGGAAFGSINYYANTVVKYYGKETVDINNPEELNKFKEAIGRKETGFLMKKRAKRTTIEI